MHKHSVIYTCEYFNHKFWQRRPHDRGGANRHTPVVPEADIAVGVDGSMISEARDA
jgi:hypothetical protein